MSTRRALTTLFLAATLAVVAFAPSCGGGPSGTAQSTVQGNVAAVEQARRGEPSLLARVLDLVRPITSAWAQNGFDGIRVSIEGTPFETETNESGEFVLESPYSGAGTLLFRRENDQLAARIGVEVPAGGTVTLRNVRCSRGQGSCRADAIEVQQPSPSEPSEPSDVSGAPRAGRSGSPAEVSDPSEPSVSDPSPARPEDPSEPSEPSLSEPSVSEDGPSDD
jgi:hypothetical protein